MNHAAEPLSTSEGSFTLRAIENGLRVDGRRRLEARPIAVAFGNDAAGGCVQVRLGETKILAVATAELVEPYPDRPAEGLLQFFVEFSPMASPEFEPGRPSEAAIEMMRLLERAVRKSRAVDVESMCVVAGQHVWAVRCDVTVLDHRGNLTDASLLAAIASLKHLRIPAVSVSGTGEDAAVRVLPVEQADPQPLVFHHTPVAVSLGFFQGSDAGPICYAVDPNEREEMVSVSSLTVVLNQHQELCALEKPGGVPVDDSQLLECVQRAAAIAPQRLMVLDEVLEAHARKLAEAAETLRRTGRVAAPSAGSAAAPALTVEMVAAEGTAEQSTTAMAAVGASPAEPVSTAAVTSAACTSGKANAKRKRGGKKKSTEDSVNDDDEEVTRTVHSAFTMT